jgi:uncharacterized membrane protein YdjX (TVP38/TMEM64 family)
MIGKGFGGTVGSSFGSVTRVGAGLAGKNMISSEPAARPSRLVRALPILVLVAGAVAFFGFGLHRYVSFATLSAHRAALTDWVAGHGLLAPLAYIAAYVVVVAFSLPGSALLTITGGFLFGIVLGATYAVIGATIGATVIFIAARTAFADLLRAKAGGAIARMEEGFRRDALSYLLVLRLVPLFPFFLVNLVPAFLGVSLGTYVIATFFGIMPGALVYASVGNGLGAVFDRGGEPNLHIIFTAPILLPILGIAALSLIPVAYRRWRGA